MSDEFDGLDATEKAGIEAALNRCRPLATKIESELRNKGHGRFVDKLSLADFYASLEHAADVLGRETQQSVENTPAPRGEGLAGAGPSEPAIIDGDDLRFPPLSRA